MTEIKEINRIEQWEQRRIELIIRLVYFLALRHDDVIINYETVTNKELDNLTQKTRN